MIPAINNIWTNTTLVNLSQNTAMRVSCETGLKAVGRPGFILADPDLDKEKKKYASAKELLYQLICLGVYLAVIPFVFTKGTFALAKNLIFKNKKKGFEHFKNSSQYSRYRELATMDKNARNLLFQNKIDPNIKDEKKIKIAKKELERNRKRLELFKNNSILYNDLKNSEHPEKYNLLYGAIETGSYFGSLLGLAVLAPEVSHHLIHPIMKSIGSNNNDSK